MSGIFLIYTSKNKPPIGYVENEYDARRVIENMHITHQRHAFYVKIERIRGY